MLSRLTVVFVVSAAIASAQLPWNQVRSSGASAGCPLSEQVRLCVNHSTMQRATCASDDLDCQCIWASHAATCFAPCISEKVFADGMHVAQGEQSTICSQAAKYGPLAKERERLKQEERSGKRPKIDQQQWSQPQSAGPPKNINDVNAAHEAPATAVGGSAGPSNAAAGASATAAPKAAGNTVPARAAGGQVPKAGSIPAGSAAKSSAPARKAPKGALGGDRADTVVDSAAKSLAVGLGSIALASIAAHMVSFF